MEGFAGFFGECAGDEGVVGGLVDGDDGFGECYLVERFALKGHDAFALVVEGDGDVAGAAAGVEFVEPGVFDAAGLADEGAGWDVADEFAVSVVCVELAADGAGDEELGVADGAFGGEYEGFAAGHGVAAVGFLVGGVGGILGDADAVGECGGDGAECGGFGVEVLGGVLVWSGGFGVGRLFEDAVELLKCFEGAAGASGVDFEAVEAC